MFVADSFYCTALVKSFHSPLHPIMTASVNACKRTAGAFGRMEVARATTCREWWCQPCELLFSEDTFFLRKSDYSYLPAFLRASSNCCVSEAFGQIKSQLQTVLTLTPHPFLSIGSALSLDMSSLHSFWHSCITFYSSILLQVLIKMIVEVYFEFRLWTAMIVSN